MLVTTAPDLSQNLVTTFFGQALHKNYRMIFSLVLELLQTQQLGRQPLG